MRIAEIMTDFRNIQTYIASIRASPSAEEYNEEGYLVLRRCVAEAQALLSQPFQTFSSSRGDDEQDKAHLRRYEWQLLKYTHCWHTDTRGRIIADAATRRFRAQKIYLRATAALRWVNSRTAILQGHRPHAGHAPALQQIRNTLRAVRSAIIAADGEH